ncbi:hypothetical protein EMPG_10038 [Blastomyces silverae]|uniref:Uncharacterized protein n=1 Tax=Blastomyces silverae TaxID=2060906 RepID=A0A0H1BBF0_9EURO|nr:hypothetical protein EMPG_10038 [Blastomyces silverae]
MLLSLASAVAFLSPVATAASGGTSGWDEFTNNLATDLGPLIWLFGEQVTKQFLSESLSIWDNVIFAMAPLGIITAVVSAIRVSDKSSLRAFIGRAQESRGSAELELLSCTSETTSELWNEGGIARVFGKPKILELVYHRSRLDGSMSPGNWLRNAGIFTFKEATEIYKLWERERSDIDASSLDDNRLRSPNLSLNIGIKRPANEILIGIAGFGVLLQGGVLFFAAWIAYKHPSLFLKNGKEMSAYACPFVLTGTMATCLGMFLCALIIERTTNETYYKKADGSDTELLWIQPGGQKVGEQVFNAFIGKANVSRYVESNRVKRQVKEDYRLWAAVALTIGGFIIQFVGLRGMHAAVTLAQLGSTVIMAIIRASLRSQRMSEDDNILAKYLSDDKKRLIVGHELDWFAMHLHKLDEFEVLIHFNILDLLATSELPDPLYEHDHDTSFSNECTPSVLRPLKARARLAQLTSGPEAFSWEEMELRQTVRQLQATLQDSMNILYTKDFEIREDFIILVSYNGCGGKGEKLVKLQFSRDLRNSASWTTDPSHLEALLGLWTWSKLAKLPKGTLPALSHFRFLDRYDPNRSRFQRNGFQIWIPTEECKSVSVKIINRPFRGFGQPIDDNSPEVLVSIRPGTTLRMCAHDLYIAVLAAILALKSSVPGKTDLSIIGQTSLRIQFRHTGIDSLAQAFMSSGLGTRQDAYFCIIPTLNLTRKLPKYSEVVSLVSKAVETYKRANYYLKAEYLMRWRATNFDDEERVSSEMELIEFFGEMILISVSGLGWDGMVNIRNIVSSQEALSQAQSYQDIAIHIAKHRNLMHYAEKLQQQGARIARADGFDESQSVAKWSKLNNLLAVRYLVKISPGNAMEPDESDATRRQPLEWAVINGNLNMIRFLLTDQNVTPFPDSENRDAISHASENGRADILELLLQRSMASINHASRESRKTSLMYAAERGHADSVALLLASEGIHIQEIDSSGYTAFQTAVRNRHVEVVKELLKHEQTDPDFAFGESGHTPLYLAASNGHHFIVMLLMNRLGVNINCGAVAAAAENGHEAVVRLLLRRRSIDINNRSPLAFAATGGHEAIVQLLLRHDGVDVNGEGQLAGAPPNTRPENTSSDAHVSSPHVSANFSPLSAAAEKGHKAIAKLLLSQPGIDVNLHSPLARAAYHGHDEIVLLLLCHEGSDVDIDGTVVIEGFQKPMTALDCAAAGGHDLIVQLLQDWTSSIMVQNCPSTPTPTSDHEKLI